MLIKFAVNENKVKKMWSKYHGIFIPYNVAHKT